MPYCTECGAQCSEGGFCEKCGAKLLQVLPKERERRTNPFPIPVIILVIVAVVLFFVLR